MTTRDADGPLMPLVNQPIILKVYIYVWALINLATSAFSKLPWVRQVIIGLQAAEGSQNIDHSGKACICFAM